ncbi:MAG: cobalamin B12-binding domain-containing protein [Hyphomonadaceae bacterium]|nr:cobalamin B12-binding domain-containing protein [Hyphomonadaceae bacterium]
MDSLPRSPAFDLCGEEPMRLAPGGKRGASLAIVEGKAKPPLADDLARLVEGEIIPRLMLVHRSEQREERDTASLGPDLAEKFALYALSSGHDSLLAIIGTLLQQRVSIESIYLDLLGPAARRLGEFWDEDRVSFADVTIALGRLQHVVRELSLHGSQDTMWASTGRSALFAAAPGEQHTFGLVIIEEFFRRSGWRTWAELSGSTEEVVSAVKAHHFDLFGMTAGSDDRLDQIAPMVMSVRKASKNPDITVMVGGRLFVERPELVAKVGADAMATDARQAVMVADGAVRKLALR